MSDIIEATAEGSKFANTALQLVRDLLGVDEKKIVNKAKAEVHAMQVISDGKMNIEAQEIFKQSVTRLMEQEIYRQKNYEGIAQVASKYLGNTITIPTSLTDEFQQRFSDSSKNATEENIREFFGRLLAQEIHKPGSVSPRTLEFMKTLSRDEAELIKKYLPFVIRLSNEFVILGGPVSKGLFGMTISELIKLQELGFLSFNDTLQMEFKPNQDIYIQYQEKAMAGRNQGNTRLIKCYPVTQFAKDLSTALTPESNNLYYSLIFQQFPDVAFVETGIQ